MLLHASLAWSGFFSAADVNKLDNFYTNTKKLYNCKQLASGITKLFQLANESL